MFLVQGSGCISRASSRARAIISSATWRERATALRESERGGVLKERARHRAQRTREEERVGERVRQRDSVLRERERETACSEIAPPGESETPFSERERERESERERE